MILLLGCLFLRVLVTTYGESRAPRITEHPSDVTVRRHEPATLNCAAEGRPTPRVAWFRYEGGGGRRREEEVVTDTPNRMRLPSGALFFLHVLQREDAGTYWCEARNEAGEARSRNATLQVAVLRDEFRWLPRAASVRAGAAATLRCGPPRGQPEPRVRWLKDGRPLEEEGRGRVSAGGGELRIADARQADAGRYSCVAENMAGTRETPPVLLTVHDGEARHVSAVSGADVELPCGAEEGTWRREGGDLPSGRTEVTANGSLLIKQVLVADEGTYACEAENPLGAVSVTLAVHSRPSFLVRPKDQRIGLNGIAKFECSADGNPFPSIFWSKEGSQVLMFPDRAHGRFSVSREGSLVISGVRREDDGYFVCSVISGVGSAMARAYLEVASVSGVPPPVIRVGPANQTLPLRADALLPCEADAARVTWRRDPPPLPARPRAAQLDSGALRIAGLSLSFYALQRLEMTADHRVQ